MKTVIVTGASGGIGEAISRLFAKNGYKVGVHGYKNYEKAKAIADEIGGFPLKFDLKDFSAVGKGVKEFFEKFGQIDALINNGGIAQAIKPIIDVTEEEYDEILDTNLKGAFASIKTAIPYMLEKGGSIVNISSMWGITGGSCEAVYSASKFALIGLTKSLAKEYAKANIRVNAVAPGLIDTAMNSVLSDEDKRLAVDDIPLGRIGKAEEVAEAVYYLVEKATFTTGEVLNVTGGEVI